MPSIRSLACVSLALAMFAIPRASFAQIVAVSTIVEPPGLAVEDQPISPGDGYIWTPGYWAWGASDYAWVPGRWVLAPQVGFLWTPGYWGWADGRYFWHEGWWGEHVGFYGGVYYGYGYGGVGYDGGYWNRGRFYYNTTVNHLDGRYRYNTYRRTLIVHEVTRVSYNGGRGGLAARPTPQQESFARAHHAPPTAEQSHHVQVAIASPSQRFSVNHGAPPRPVAATPKPAGSADRGIAPGRTAAGRGTADRARTPGARPGAQPQQKGTPRTASKAPAKAPAKAAPAKAPAKAKPHK